MSFGTISLQITVDTYLFMDSDEEMNEGLDRDTKNLKASEDEKRIEDTKEVGPIEAPMPSSLIDDE